jgi:exodeoxyribonuclease VII large subunit
MEELSLNFDAPEDIEPPRKQTYTVSEITAEVHRLISRNFDDVRVAGEISGLKVWSSGHAYFSLKDGGALLRAVIWKSSLRYMRVKPQEGMAVIARGSLEVRAERGEYQMIVSALEPQGAGALMLAFERLKTRLAEEGLFDEERKRLLPRFPRRIGIVTSPQGAVIRDMITVFTRRWPGIHLRLYPTLVQGEGAAEGICAGLRYFSESGWADVVVVGRGGGSLEDLWAFNEEAVARAIAECRTPVVSAVGHETDFTIADFAADLRAPTPSAAAELIVPDARAVLEQVETSRRRVARAIEHLLNVLRRRLGELGTERASRHLHRQVGRYQQRVDEAAYALESSMQQRLLLHRRQWAELDRRLRDQDLRLRLARDRQRWLAASQRLRELLRSRLLPDRQRWKLLQARLVALSPLAVLERGYAIVQNDRGTLVIAPEQAPPSSRLDIRLARGRLRARVEAEQPPTE